jgi:predicted dehydrogenase
VRNLPIRLTVTEANGRGGVSERVENPVWGDPFVAEWQAFHANVMGGLSPKTTPADFRQDLELFQQMIVCMQR